MTHPRIKARNLIAKCLFILSFISRSKEFFVIWPLGLVLIYSEHLQTPLIFSELFKQPSSFHLSVLCCLGVPSGRISTGSAAVIPETLERINHTHPGRRVWSQACSRSGHCRNGWRSGGWCSVKGGGSVSQWTVQSEQSCVVVQLWPPGSRGCLQRRSFGIECVLLKCKTSNMSDHREYCRISELVTPLNVMEGTTSHYSIAEHKRIQAALREETLVHT